MTSPVIETDNLGKDHRSHIFGRRLPAVEALSIRVAAGETYALIGVNGAGKTTTLKLLLGLSKATSGTASVLGFPAGDRRALGRVGFLPEEPYFYSYLSGLEMLTFAGQMFGQGRKERKERALALLKMVSLHEYMDLPLRRHSRGMLQRLGIAQALMNDPEVIFLDEPLSGLDPIGRRDVMSIMLRLKAEGKTVFFNSHLLPDVNELCDRVGVLHQGHLVAEERVAAITGLGSYRDLERYFLETVGGAEAGRKAAFAFS